MRARRSVPLRHTGWLLCALVAMPLYAANPAITLEVSSETAPPGGYAQFKIILAAPALVSTASISMTFDPTIFGPVANVAAFSATGDQIGYANQGAQGVSAYFTSASSSIGQLPQLPVFVVTVPVLATAKAGASSVTVDPTQAAWKDSQGNTYTVGVNPGTFTVGGTLSVESVTPGGGLLPPGTVVSINGSGFDATTSVTIDGVSLGSPQLVSPQQIDVTLAGATEMSGKHVHVTASSASVDYFASLAAPVTFDGTDNLALLLPSLPSVPQTTAQWQFPNYEFTYYSCLQNPGPTPVTVNSYYGSNTQLGGEASMVIPPYGLSIVDDGTRNNTVILYTTASAPLRMTEYFFTYGSGGLAGGLQEIGVAPVPPITSLGVFGIFGLPSVAVLNQQLGTPPQTLPALVGSGFPVTVSLSGGAQEWLQVKLIPESGGLPAILTLTPIVSNLSAGTYTGTITLTENLPPDLAPFGSNSATMTLTLNVSAQPMLINPNGNTQFIVAPGAPAPAPSVVTLATNGTPAPFTASIAPVSGGNWLSVTPSSGTTPGPLTLTANPTGLSSGTYTASLIVQGPLNTLTVPATLAIVLTTVTVTPASVSFTFAPGQDASTIVQLVTGSPDPSFTFSVSTQTGGNWLTASAFLPGSLQVSANAFNLGPGTYQGTVTIVATPPLSGTVTVPVTLTVTALGQQFTVSPSSLTLSGPAGAAASGNLNVNVVSGPPYFTVSSTGVGFKVTPPSSTSTYMAPATIMVSATATGSITIGWNGGSTTIPVTYYATPTPSNPPTMSFLVASGSETPGSIAPGELISIFGSSLGGVPAGLRLNSNQTVATNLGGTEVLINGSSAPLIYSSAGQVNAIVPFEATGLATVQVVAEGIPSGSWAIPVAPSAPSIFTANGTGMGQAAIVNQDGSFNSASNPAARGTAIQIYATGGGQTSPPSSTGSVAQGAASLALSTTVTIGGVTAQVLYAGSAPGEVDGVVQINAIVPPGATPGSVPIIVTIGGVASQPGVTLAIQ